MRKDLEPDQLASIAISRDEIAGRQRPVGRVGVAPASSGAPKILWVLTLLSLVLTAGLYVHLQQVKTQSDKQLKALTILQERLSSTDEQANLSVDAIKILLKDQDHEIRKLWDVANKRNKNQISKNTSRLDDQNKLVTQYASKVEQLSKDGAKLSDTLTKKVSESELAITSKIQTVKNAMNEIDSKVDKAIKGIPKDLSKTLSDHEKGIKAMDRTRLQLLKKIKALESELKKMKGAAQSTPSSPPA